MTKTFRNRRQCPKELKVRDGKPWACFDNKNIEYWFDNHSYTKIRYRNFHPIAWSPGSFYTNKRSPIENFYVHYFNENKISEEIHFVKYFKNPRRDYGSSRTQHRKFDNKKVRKNRKDLMQKEMWEKIPVIFEKCKAFYYW